MNGYKTVRFMMVKEKKEKKKSKEWIVNIKKTKGCKDKWVKSKQPRLYKERNINKESLE